MKAVIQLCIYFCVLGFVVHAQTPDAGASDAATQLDNLYEAMVNHDGLLSQVEKEYLEAKAKSEGLEANRKASFWDFVFGPSNEEEAKYLKDLAEANKDFIEKEQKWFAEKNDWLGRRLQIQALNARTNVHPRERVFEILAERKQHRSLEANPIRTANVPPGAKQTPPSQK